MKKIYAIAALSLGATALTSCEDFLDQVSESEINTETCYESQYYTSLRINKIYGGLTQDQTYSQYIPISFGTNTDCELIDGLGQNAKDESERGYMNYNASASDTKGQLAKMWTAMYGVIEDCNLAIDGIRNSSIIKGTASEQKAMKRYLGEALTLRAMVYLDLVRFFGDIPMKLNPSQADLSNAYMEKTDRDVILDTLLLNLDEATKILPWAGDGEYTTEHVTRGYADALYAQVALTRAGYAIREKAKSGYVTAEKYSDPVYPTQRPDDQTRKALYEKALVKLADVIENGPHALNPSFEDEWYRINQLELDQDYRENIFEIPMGLNVSSELGYTIGVRLSGATSKFGYSNSSGKVKLTAPFFYSFDKNDLRRDITCAPYEIKEVDGVTKEQMQGNNPFQIYVGKWDARKMSDSWKAYNLVAGAKMMTGINVVKMRYSQLLLLYAETLNELAGPDASYKGAASLTARQALAMVRARAFDADHKAEAIAYVAKCSDKESLFSAIVDENAWELAGEGIRKFDLIRWHLLVEKVNQMKAKYVSDLENGVYPAKLSFNYKTAAKTEIDMSSVQWYQAPVNVDSYHETKTWYGAEADDEKQTQLNTNLPGICSGLGGVEGASSPVVNRYILPIAATTISASNGYLKNSYGY